LAALRILWRSETASTVKREITSPMAEENWSSRRAAAGICSRGWVTPKFTSAMPSRARASQTKPWRRSPSRTAPQGTCTNQKISEDITPRFT
jgi:hypothetical protein